MDVLRVLVYEIFLPTFFMRKEKSNHFFITFYISHKSSIKTFLK